MRRFFRSTTALVGILTALAVAHLPCGTAFAQQSTTPAVQWRHYPREPAAPAGAPNVLLIMTDDVGFAATSTFGGPIPTPTFDALAQAGLRYNGFHTTAMCSPTRAALLTGRNHHAVATGSITNVSIDAPGYTSVIPGSAATIARVLRDNGYDTAFFGKNHNTPEWETGPLGPFEHWPIGFGFNYFYGFNAAAADQFAPSLIENTNAIEPSRNDPDFIFDRAMSDKLIHWLRIQRNLRPNHPFFAYVAPGTLHSPHQAPADWIARFRGRFDQGWDRLREQIFTHQKRLGIIPANARLATRPPGLPAWSDLNQAQRAMYARQMEVAAAQLAFHDFETGRVIEELRASGQLDNTLVIYLQGDNGSSMESRLGANQELMTLIGVEPTEQELLAGQAAHGGPHSYANYSAAWGFALNTPFPWGKQVASHLGGLRDGLVISWPRRIADRGGLRAQFHHVTDIAPTIYEAAGITPPAQVDGVAQQPIDGVSMVYSFDQRNAPSRRREQYFEMLGNRGYYKDGWFAATTPARGPWDRNTRPTDPAQFAWELYDLRTDFSQTRNVAAAHPEKLAELRADFARAAAQYNLEPITSDLIGRVGPEHRPSLLRGRTRYVYYPGDTRYPPSSFPSLAAGWKLDADIVVDDQNASGPIVVQGDEFGGMGLMLQNGRPIYIYNPTGREAERVTLQASALSRGAHRLSVAVEPTPQAGARAARVALSVDGRPEAHADVQVYYRSRGEGVVGRYGVKELVPGMEAPAAAGYQIGSVEYARDSD
jgi:arylsulfatase